MYALAPTLIFPKKNYRDHFIRGVPNGSIGTANSSGWINENIFIDFIVHVAKLTRCYPDRKI